MELFFLVLALALPIALGASCLGLLVPPATVGGQRALILGNGTLIGLMTIPILMRLLDSLGITPGFRAAAPLAGLMVVLAGVAHLRRKARPLPAGGPCEGFSALPRSHQALLLVLLALLALRVTSLGLELLWRPLFPWDATMHWATKARVWFEYDSIVPFVERDLWLKLGGKGVFTDHHPGYPVTTPLLQLWMTSALGSWDESLMNLPWLLCFIALGAAFYGQACAAGASSTLSLVFTYLLLSMPLINTHVALAGYADLFLGACYGMAIMAFHNWSVTRQSWQGALALFFAICCPLIKNEGLYWALTFAPALVVVVLPRRKAAILLALLLLALACLLLLLPRELAIAGHSLDRLRLQFRPEAVPAIAISVFVQDNWHLFGYLLTGLLPLGLLIARPGEIADTYRGITTALACALGLLLVLFLFTGYAAGAIRFTAVGRISIHLVPGLAFLAMLLCNEIFRRDRFRMLQDP